MPLFCVLSNEILQMPRTSSRRPAVHDAALHPWLTFPDTIEGAARFRQRLEKLQPKHIDVRPTFDWTFLTHVGLVEQIEPYTVHDVEGPEGPTFTCHGFDRLFRMSYPVYEVLTREFFSTFTFGGSKAMDTAVTFRLGGQARQITLAELMWRIGVYTQEETQSQGFADFMESCYTIHPDEGTLGEFWSRIATTIFIPRDSKESSIRDPVYRLLHKLLARTIC